MKLTLSTILILVSVTLFAQKKVLDHPDFDIWNTIKNQTISNDGQFVMYSLEKGEKDNFLKIKDAKATLVFDHERAGNGQFTYDANFALFTIKAWKDSILELKRPKVKKDKLPKDTLGIYNLKENSLVKIANVKSYKLPEKWSGYVAYLLEDLKKDKKQEKKEKDTASTGKKEKKKGPKEVSDKNGFHLVLRNLNTNNQDTLKFVTNYVFAKEGRRFTYITTGEKGKSKAGVYVMNLDSHQLSHVFEATKKSKYYQLSFSDSGKNLGFIVDTDTTKILVRPNKLYVWQDGKTSLEKLVDAASAPQGYRVSSDGKISFSKDDTKLFFGLATPAIVQDTTLLNEEIVNVEVWTYNEPRLYTVQELQVKNDKKKSYQTAIHLNNANKLVQLATIAYPNAQLANEGNATYALTSNPVPYQLESQWTGNKASDYAIVNTNTGETKTALTKMVGKVRLSPQGDYVYGYNPVDTTWFSYDIAAGKLLNLTKGKVFYDELNDSPKYPGSYGIAGWTENDEALLIYDRYDIWKFDPTSGKSKRLTNGRENSVPGAA